ncbi:MAG: ADP-ribosylglycohydrolase family protein [Lachnospiraceae bacterium]|nr:ADP-ribosylglycohydrolase family protein [Robinsoniella sp.]MDY3765072.1 ADP-ribosylglycohydrolase family protein [Lachnospiraceae bacterium]
MSMCMALPQAAMAAEAETTQQTERFSEDEILNKMKGGWAGQMAGVTWGAPTEFYNFRKFFEIDPNMTIIPEDLVPEWTPETINDAFNQDDLYVDITFLDCLKDNGPQADWSLFGEYFGESQYRLWHANKWGCDNVRAGIQTPWSGHYSNTLHCDDIDWQIECDAVGMACLGQPEAVKELSWRLGHVMNYGDGVYGGVYVSTMYAAAFTAGSVDEIIKAGMNAIPQESQFWQVQNDVLQCKQDGMTWEETREFLAGKWENDRCPSGLYNTKFNIDAKMNSAFITIGLVYGEGDLEKSMLISMRCGQDSDCNPASVAGILGCFYGYDALDEKWTSAIDWDGTKFEYTDYTLNEAVQANMDVARTILEVNGGKVEDGQWIIPVSDYEGSMILEQWPKEMNAMPEFDYVVCNNGEGMTVHFDAKASDEDGIKDYQWFFGDLSFESGKTVSHTYREAGTYRVTCYVTDEIGNTSWQQIDVLVTE